MEDSGASSYHRYLKGDREGLVDIVEEYYDGLVRYLERFVNNETDAEDMAEETLLVLMNKRLLLRSLDLSGRFVPGARRRARLAVQHLHLAGHDFRGVAVCAVLILPLASLQFALNVHLAAFVQVLTANLCQPAPDNNPMPFRRGLRLAVLILPAFSGCHGKGGHLNATLREAGSWVCAQIANQNHLVQHFVVSFASRCAALCSFFGSAYSGAFIRP